MALTEIEMVMAREAALFQRAKSIGDGRSHRNSVLRDDEAHIENEIQGKIAEMAFAKLLGVYYDCKLDTFSQFPDVAHCDVRSVDSLTKCLIIRDDDKEHRPFVLAVVWRHRVKFVGWLYAHEGKRPEFRRNPHGKRESWFVPQGHLRGMDTLPPG